MNLVVDEVFLFEPQNFENRKILALLWGPEPNLPDKLIIQQMIFYSNFLLQIQTLDLHSRVNQSLKKILYLLIGLSIH